MQFLPPELDDLEKGVMQQIAGLEDELRYLLDASTSRWQPLLKRTALAAAIHGSVSIEGFGLTDDDSLAVLEGGEPLESDEEAWAAAISYRSAVTCAMQLAGDPYFRYSTDWVRALHFMMMQYDLSRNPARWRAGSKYIRDDPKGPAKYEGPGARQVQALMTQLADALNSAPAESLEDAMVTGAMVHLNLLMILPFSDGNGRVARCLQSLVMARGGSLPPDLSGIEEYLSLNRRAYFNLLNTVGGKTWQPGRDTRLWLRFCLTGHHWQLSTYLNRAREYDRLWQTLDSEVRKLGLPERLVFALIDAAVGHAVRNATYRPLADVSDQVASRDLSAAVKQRFLTPLGEHRGRFYVASEELSEIRDKVLEDEKIADPFEVVAAAR